MRGANGVLLLVALVFLLVLIPVHAARSENAIPSDPPTPRWGKVDPDLRDRLSDLSTEATVEFVLRLTEGAALAEVQFQRQEVVQRLQAVAAGSRADLLPLLHGAGFRVASSFWITNALLVQGPAGQVPFLTASPLVARLHTNFQVSLLGVQSIPPKDVSVSFLTWGLERVGAARVWSELGVRGAGVRVCVSDTGVDVGHPDLIGKMWTDVAGEATYPGGWIEFSSSGNPVGGSTPHDTHGHGTHTSGTILGGETSGTAIGMAPEAFLMHALVLPGGGGTFAQVIAGIEWCVSPFDASGTPAGQPADVHSMSWGASGYPSEMVDPIRNSYLAGTLPVAAAGNCGEGCTNSPGDLYDALSIGASDDADLIPTFSSGGIVRKTFWPSPPADWPEEWTVPLLAAPGVDVYSSLPGGSYGTWSGTSMATPHVAGCAGLMLASSPGLTSDEVRLALVETAVWFDTYAPDPPDTRYGWGRLDCRAATENVAFNGGIRGLVRDLEDGAPVLEARINVSALGPQRQVESDGAGAFRMRLRPGTYDLTVSRFGYLSKTLMNITVASEAWTDLDILLPPLPRANITGTAFSSSSGIGIPGVLVEVTGIPVTVEATTDRNGAFVLGKVPEGNYDLRASSPYFQDAWIFGLPIVRGTDSNVSFFLIPLLGVQVVDFQLEVTPQTGLWYETFQATIQAKNVDSLGGDYTARLYVNNGLEAVQTVALASGETRSLTFALARDPVGFYAVALGPHRSSFRVRPPVVDLQVRALNGTSLPGASVTVGQVTGVLEMGETDGNGSLTFDSPGGSHGQYWIVVQAQDPVSGGVHYFLSRELLVEDDLIVAFEPTESGTTRLELSMESIVGGAQGSVHLRRSEMPVAFSQAYAFPPGSVVVDSASYSVWSDVTWTSPGSSWRYETANVTWNVASIPSAQYAFGGRLNAWVAWSQAGPNATAEWNIQDAYGNDLLTVLQARAGILGAGETTFHLPFLSFWNAQGEVLASGYVEWSQQPAVTTVPENETVAFVQVDLETGGYPFDATFALDVVVLDEEGPILPQMGATRATAVLAVGTVLLAGIPVPATLTINDEAVMVHPDGSFSHAVNLTRGLNTLVIHAEDPAGNVKDKVYVIESKPDVALIVLPIPAYVNVTSVEVVGLVEPGARLTINGEATQPETDGSFRFRWELVEGPNSLVVAAEDFVGNRAEASYEVIRDTVPPAIVLLAPSVGHRTPNATVFFMGRTELPALFTLNGFAVPLEGGNFAYELDLETGDNAFLLEARDPAGNVRTMSLIVHRESIPSGLPVMPDEFLTTAALAAAGVGVGVGAYILGRWQRRGAVPRRKRGELVRLAVAVEDLDAALGDLGESHGPDVVKTQE